VRRAALGLVVLVALLAGCTPDGQPCHRAGDVKVQDGHSYTCTNKRGGLVWK
jgi:hypothetical protein